MSPSKRKKVGGDLRAPFADTEENAPGGRVPPQDEAPGVPGFRSWRGVYWFVFGWFAAVVVALTIFSWAYA